MHYPHIDTITIEAPRYTSVRPVPVHAQPAPAFPAAGNDGADRSASSRPVFDTDGPATCLVHLYN